MRTFAIGDIHGGLKAVIQLLEKLNVTKDDTLIFLGDYVDGWSQSAQVIEYLIEFSKSHRCIFVKGNHDIWCEDWLRTNNADPVWLLHGGKGTVESYNSMLETKKKAHLTFFLQMKPYYIDSKNRLFIHAGFTSMHGVERENFKDNFYYDRTLWEMAVTMDKTITEDSNKYPDRLKHYKEIYIGHTPTIRYNSPTPINCVNVWNVDTGAAFTGKLSAIDVDTKQVYQTDVLQTLYPNEKGRN